MNTLLSNFFSICDAPRAWGVYFQDSASPQMEALVELHDNIMFYLVIILFGVGWILVSIIRNYVSSRSPISNKYLNHGTLIELIWTITPALILILIEFPRFKLLYLMDEVTDPSLTVFVEGHQWYWSYQYPDFLNEDDEELEFEWDVQILFLEKFYLKQAISEASIGEHFTSNSKTTTVFLSDIKNKSDWSNINLNHPEVKSFNRFYGSIQRASTLYSRQVDRHSNYQDGEIELAVSERELERRLEKSKANLLRRYQQLVDKQLSILSRNPRGSIPSPKNLYDWNNDDFNEKWSNNNNSNLNNN